MMYVAKPECGLIIGGVMLYMDYYRENKEKNYLDQVIVVGPKKLLEKAVA